jgi:hypothetical protein
MQSVSGAAEMALVIQRDQQFGVTPLEMRTGAF